MLITLEVVEAEALSLSMADRARLVEKLIISMDTVSLDSDPDIDAAWTEEIERRHSEIERGAVSLIPGPEALIRLKAEFR